jgi:hypothetical protein
MADADRSFQNRQGGKFSDQVQQYSQFQDLENLSPDLERMVRDLYERARQA